MTRIDRVGRANVADFYEIIVRDGEPALRLRNIKDLPRELSEAIKAVKHNDDGSMQLELWDKNQANFTLLKHMGGLKDEADRPVSVTNIFAGLSVDAQRTLLEALEALPAGSGVVEGEAA